jgi:hypothetical protein
LNLIDNWKILEPFKAATLKTIRKKKNYYLFIHNKKKHLLIQYSGGSFGYKLKQRFPNLAIEEIFKICCEFLIRVNYTSSIIFNLTNINIPLKNIIQYSQNLNLFIVWINFKKKISYNGCKQANPRRR